MWRLVTVTCAVAMLLILVDGRLVPSKMNWPEFRLTATTLMMYVNKTFGHSQKCLKVAADNSVEATAILAMLNNGDGSRSFNVTITRTIELDNLRNGPTLHCPAYVVIGRQLTVIEEYMENFRSKAIERMLVVIVQSKKYIKAFIKYSPLHFDYKDIILINVYSTRETVFQMSINYGKFISVSTLQDQWFRHDLEGKLKVKNFHQTRIKLLTYNNSFFSSLIENNATGKLTLSNGVECSIFKEIATRLNITWDVYTTEDSDKWGTAWSNDTVTGGALRQLYIKRMDVAFCSLWIESIRLKFMDMSKFWSLMCLKFLVPKPQPLREKWDLLFKPFPLSLWLLVVSSAILTIITVWILTSIQKTIGYERINAFSSLTSIIFWIIGSMLLTNNPHTHRMGPIRHLINCWCIFVFIMSTSFSSILYSYITSPEYTDIILEVEDMVRANYHWGLTYPPPFENLLQMQNPVHRAFSKKFMPEQSVEDRIRRLEHGKYAMLTKCLLGKHFMEAEEVPVSILNNLRTARTCLNQFYVGLGFIKHSPYVKPANLVIQRITESGLIDYWLSRVTEAGRISPATFKQVYEIKPHKRGNPLPLGFRQFKVVMVVWTVGCALSVFVFAVECQYARLERNTR